MKNPILIQENQASEIESQGNYTLRDKFAGLAMQSVMTGEYYKQVETADEIAKWAYDIADAMIKERSM